jgi:hypothetical protein
VCREHGVEAELRAELERMREKLRQLEEQKDVSPERKHMAEVMG